jgi:hypothetical protein
LTTHHQLPFSGVSNCPTTEFLLAGKRNLVTFCYRHKAAIQMDRLGQYDRS